MRVRFRESIATEWMRNPVWFHAGTEADVPDELGQRFVAAGRAVECAALAPPPETTMMRGPRPKQRAVREYTK